MRKNKINQIPAYCLHYEKNPIWLFIYVWFCTKPIIICVHIFFYISSIIIRNGGKVENQLKHCSGYSFWMVENLVDVC